MIIGFSVQTNWKFYSNSNEWISFWKENNSIIGNFNAIEILVSPEQEENFKLSIDNFYWLSELKYISYHLIDFTEYTKSIIDSLPFISNIILHYDQSEIYKDKFFRRYKNKLLIENIEGLIDLNLLNNNNVCFDIAHVYNNNAIIKQYFDNNENRIKQIHVSYFDKDVKHIPIYNTGYQFNIDINKFPIILEGSFNSIEEMKNELNYIKGFNYEKRL